MTPNLTYDEALYLTQRLDPTELANAAWGLPLPMLDEQDCLPGMDLAALAAKLRSWDPQERVDFADAFQRFVRLSRDPWRSIPECVLMSGLTRETMPEPPADPEAAWWAESPGWDTVVVGVRWRCRDGRYITYYWHLVPEEAVGLLPSLWDDWRLGYVEQRIMRQGPGA